MQFVHSFITEWTPCMQFVRSFITEGTSCMQFGRSVITEGFTGIPVIPSVMQDFNVVYTTSISVMTEGIARVTVNTYTIVCVLAAALSAALRSLRSFRWRSFPLLITVCCSFTESGMRRLM